MFKKKLWSTPKNLKFLSQEEPQSFPRMEFRIRVSDLDYKEHHWRKYDPRGGLGERKGKGRKTLLRRDTQVQHPLYGPSPRWTTQMVKCCLAQALYTLGVCKWLLVWEWLFWGLCLYVLPDISGLKSKYTQDSECVSQSTIKAKRSLLVLSKSMHLIPITRVNQMFYCTYTKAFTIKDTPQGTRLSVQDLQRQHPQLQSWANHWDTRNS